MFILPEFYSLIFSSSLLFEGQRLLQVHSTAGREVVDTPGSNSMVEKGAWIDPGTFYLKANAFTCYAVQRNLSTACCMPRKSVFPRKPNITQVTADYRLIPWCKHVPVIRTLG